MKNIGFLNKIGIIYVVVDSINENNTVLGAYSSVDSAMDSMEVYLSRKYSGTQWAWYGDEHCLENVDDEWHRVYIMPYQLDNDSWRRYGKS